MLCAKGVSMFNFREGSCWNLEVEIRCLIILKVLEESGNPKGLKTDLCEALAVSSGISVGSIKAKVGNYKSEFGLTGETNSSEATKYLASSFGSMTVKELDILLNGYLLGST